MMAQVRGSHSSPSPMSRTHTHLRPVNLFFCLRFLWLGLWVASSTGTMATLLCGSRSSSASPSLCWCISMTTTSYITEGRRSRSTSSLQLPHNQAKWMSNCGDWNKQQEMGFCLYDSHIGKRDLQDVIPEVKCCQNVIRFDGSFNKPWRFPRLPKSPKVLLKWKHCWVTRHSWTSGES